MNSIELEEKRNVVASNAGAAACRIFSHTASPSFLPTTTRSVWLVVATQGTQIERTYLALRQVVELHRSSDARPAQREIAPLDKQKVQRFRQKLAKIQLGSLETSSGPYRDGTGFRIELGDICGVEIHWSHPAPKGYNALIELVSAFLTIVDEAFHK